jgi:hypothetical protein
MNRFIEIKNGVDWVANPVNPDENFADKWAAEPQKRTNFYMWLDQAQRDFGLYLASAHSDLPKDLREATVEKVEPRRGGENQPRGQATKPWRKWTARSSRDCSGRRTGYRI